MTGIFITIEGPDGAGKTSVLKEMVPKLAEISQKEMLVTREPGGNPIAEEIRHIILDPKNEEMDDRTEALLYAAARRQHLVQKILPALAEDKLVLCDRFVDSSLAYQGAGRKIGMDEVAQINHFATEGLAPDLTLYLDIDGDTGMRRLEAGRNYQDRLEIAGPEFHQRVRHGYLKILAENPDRIVLIDARMRFEDVLAACIKAITDQFPDAFEQVTL